MNVRCAYFCKGLSAGTGTNMKTRADTTQQNCLMVAYRSGIKKKQQLAVLASVKPVRDHGCIGGLI